jgi:hypothetical protein
MIIAPSINLVAHKGTASEIARNALMDVKEEEAILAAARALNP